ncbi:hypothetical protein DPMN_168151 [Dreissena polymorpha]|uniref:Uncharacterized protein n=1 Tax=Dreissena polymorpha TaxID=45954 RepID=A0A9D4F256_DREPO|nr:hypothetical protein DPMN_168151 [Dreissena polymorpha]
MMIMLVLIIDYDGVDDGDDYDDDNHGDDYDETGGDDDDCYYYDNNNNNGDAYNVMSVKMMMM